MDMFRMYGRMSQRKTGFIEEEFANHLSYRAVNRCQIRKPMGLPEWRGLKR